MVEESNNLPTPVSLGEENISVIATKERESNIALREKLLGTMSNLFITTNLSIIFVILILIFLDNYWISFSGGSWSLEKHPSVSRVIDKEVIMTLVGASTVQLGAIMVAISRYLFPK